MDYRIYFLNSNQMEKEHCESYTCMVIIYTSVKKKQCLIMNYKKADQIHWYK